MVIGSGMTPVLSVRRRPDAKYKYIAALITYNTIRAIYDVFSCQDWFVMTRIGDPDVGLPISPYILSHYMKIWPRDVL